VRVSARRGFPSFREKQNGRAEPHGTLNSAVSAVRSTALTSELTRCSRSGQVICYVAILGAFMVRIEIILPDGRKFPCKIKDRHYRRLDQKIKQLSFWQRVKLLFFKST